MTHLKHNLFIINDNSSNSMPLMNFLHTKFGDSLQITSYQSSEYALSKISSETHIVILDRIIEGMSGNTMIASIKKANPETEIIVFSSHEDIALAIHSFRQGATNYVVNNKIGFKSMASLIYTILLYPAKILFREFKVRKYLFILFLTFLSIGLIVYFTLMVEK